MQEPGTKWATLGQSDSHLHRRKDRGLWSKEEPAVRDASLKSFSTEFLFFFFNIYLLYSYLAETCL